MSRIGLAAKDTPRGQLILLFIALGSVSWLTMARVVRGQILSLKNQEFVMAARATGVSTFGIIFKHLVPNALGPVIVYATLTVPSVMLSEAFLSFLGIGVQAPYASWGSLAADGIKNIAIYPWQLIFPGVTIPDGGLLFCACGARVRTNGTSGTPPRRQRIHPAESRVKKLAAETPALLIVFFAAAGPLLVAGGEPVELEAHLLRLGASLGELFADPATGLAASDPVVNPRIPGEPTRSGANQRMGSAAVNGLGDGIQSRNWRIGGGGAPTNLFAQSKIERAAG